MQFCEACGAVLAPQAGFCSRCGERVQGQVRLPNDVALQRALHRTERKFVTVLFADIKGSLDIVLGEDPERAGETLAEVVARMSAAVRQHGGLVNQILGDGIMALFGAPQAMEDHAAQACLAALAMRSTITAEVRPAVRLRVGLGSGEVVVGAVVSDMGLHYSAAGEPVHLASRMEGAAEPNQILLTDGTRQLAAGAIEVRRRRGVAIKGQGEGVPVFELVAMQRRGGAASSGRLFGREAEMQLLRTARDRAMAGEGRAVRLVGDAGSGKSTLMREFVEAHLTDEWDVLQAAAVPHRRTSYGVMSDLLMRLFRLAPGDGTEVRRAKVTAALQLPDGDVDTLSPLSPLLKLDAETAGWTAMESLQRRELTLNAAVDAFAVIGARQPLALLIEDAHWLDPESAAGIRRLGRTAAGRRMLGVVTARVTDAREDADWAGGDWSPCPVEMLGESGTLALLRNRILPGPDVASLERKLIRHTKGNPLFLEECLQALVDAGSLEREGAMLRLLGPVATLGVPASLRGLLDARVDRLPAEDKDVLQAAAVVGSHVPLDLLRGVSQMDTVPMHAALQRLEDGGFLLMEAGGGYSFRHGLTREAAYASLLKRTRVKMHATVLALLEEGRSAAEEVVDLLANHAVEAEDWPKAVGYADQAAARAYDRYANPEAVHYYDQALAAARSLPAGAARNARLLDLTIKVRFPLFRLGNVKALGPHLDEAVRLAEASQAEGGAHDGLAQALVLRSHVHWLRGQPERALADADAAETLALRHDDRDLMVRSGFQRGLVALSSGYVAGVVAPMEAVVDHIAAGGSRRYALSDQLVITALAYLARGHAAVGSLGPARVAADQANARAAALDHGATTVYAQLSEGIVCMAEGRPAAALGALAAADELCRGADLRLLSPVVAQFLAQAHLAAGSVSRALPIARQAVEDAERMGFMATHPHRLAVLADALLAGGQLAEAETRALAAQSLAERMGEHGAEAMAYAVLADVLERQRRDGSEALEAAVDRASEWGLSMAVLRPPTRRGRDGFGE